MPEQRTARDVMKPAEAETPTLVADADTSLDQILDLLSPALYERPELPGVFVREEDRIVGLIPRQRLVALAADPVIRTSGELAGTPQRRARYFVCPRGHHEDLVLLYDPMDPPVCPICGTPLREEG